MTVIEIVARTFSIQLPDGRLIFRPWGGRGPCYLLSQQQRTVRAWVQLIFYASAVSSIWLFPDIIGSTSGLITFFVTFTLGNFVLFWLFSIGLPETDKPPPLTPEQRQAALSEHSRALGRPLLWLAAGVSWSFALAGGAMALLLQQWVKGALVLMLFGAFAALFTWQLWLIRKRSDA
jgi:hypothetical protein